jgi:dTDP-4-amino-4,6-dideoxygalactose transaminase
VKTSAGELAVLGGTPTFTEPLHVGRPNLGSRESLIRRLDEMMDRRWLTNDGPLVQEFERRLSEFVGVRNCVAVANGTAALGVLARAANLEGEVILPSFTFVGTAHALSWIGLNPVFCDIDPETHTIDPERAEELVSSQTSGILGVHLWGGASGIDELEAVGRRHALMVFFDAAHAFGAAHGGRRVGTFGAAEVFSFHATKIVNCFEGGAVATNDDELADRVRLLRNYGFEDYDRVIALGTNAKMTEAAAAMGLTSLASIEEFIACNVRNLECYRRGLAFLPGLRLVSPDPGTGANGHYVVVDVDVQAEDGLTRDELQQVLWREGVLARRYFYPGCHAMEPYATLAPEVRRRLPATEALVQRILCLPTGTAVTEDDVGSICSIIELAQTHREDVRARLGAE